jgi:hypothetical protein
MTTAGFVALGEVEVLVHLYDVASEHGAGAPTPGTDSFPGCSTGVIDHSLRLWRLTGCFG